MRAKLINDDWRLTRTAGIAGLFGGAAPEHVRLPHDATIGAARSADAPSGADKGYFPNGAITLERNIDIADDDDQVILELDGVHANSSVFVNGQFVSQRPNGYARQFIDLSPALRRGRNSLQVIARSRNDSRWYTGLGAHRNAYLHEGGPVHVVPRSLIVLPHDSGSSARLDVHLRVFNAHETETAVVVRVRILDEGVEKASAQIELLTSSGTVEALIPVELADPHLWTPDDPHRYECQVSLHTNNGDEDADSTLFGVRYITLDPDNGLCLNGEPVKLRGACVHHDHGPLGAASFERAEERRIELLKAAGFNAVRSAHNSASEGLLDACDRLGMLVMDEFTDVWHTPKTADDYSTAFHEWWERDLTDLVSKVGNHPSVIMVSVGNEIPETGDFHGAATARALADLVHRLDDTRLVTLALNGLFVYTAGPGAAAASGTDASAGMDVNALMANFDAMMNQMAQAPIVDEVISPTAELLDVAGYNYMDARYEHDLAKYPERYICGTESYPKAIGRIWPLVEANPRLIGDFTWTGWDYIGEAGVGKIDYREDSGPMYAAFPWSLAYCGDFDITGFRRPASYYREITFGLRAEPYLVAIDPTRTDITPKTLPWSWTDAHATWTWQLNAGTPIQVDVYSNAESVELLLNGTSLGTRRVGEDFPNQATFTVPYAPGELVAVNHRHGSPAEEAHLVTAKTETELLLRTDRTVATTDPGELVHVNIEVADKNGIVHNDQTRTVNVTVEGPAVLQGLGTGNPMDITPFTDSSRQTFGGRALAVLRPTGAEGHVRVKVVTDHGESAEISFEVSSTDTPAWRHTTKSLTVGTTTVGPGR